MAKLLAIVFAIAFFIWLGLAATLWAFDKEKSWKNAFEMLFGWLA